MIGNKSLSLIKIPQPLFFSRKIKKSYRIMNGTESWASASSAIIQRFVQSWSGGTVLYNCGKMAPLVRMMGTVGRLFHILRVPQRGKLHLTPINSPTSFIIQMTSVKRRLHFNKRFLTGCSIFDLCEVPLVYGWWQGSLWSLVRTRIFLSSQKLPSLLSLLILFIITVYWGK